MGDSVLLCPPLAPTEEGRSQTHVHVVTACSQPGGQHPCAHTRTMPCTVEVTEEDILGPTGVPALSHGHTGDGHSPCNGTLAFFGWHKEKQCW